VDSAGAAARGPRSLTVPRRTALGICALYALFGTLWIIASDRLLPDLGGTSEQIVWLGTAKGILFILVTSTLLYALLRVAPRAPEQVGGNAPRGWLLGAIFLLLAAAILGIGHQVYRQNLRNFEERSYALLRAVTDTKVLRVAGWYEAQARAVGAIGRTHAVSNYAADAVAGDAAAVAALRFDLAHMAHAFGMASIVLADRDGVALLTVGQSAAPELVAAATAEATARKLGFAVAQPGADVATQVAFAYRLPARTGLRAPRRFLIGVVDIEPELTSMVRAWPVQGSHGESVLTRLGPGGELVLLPGFQAPLLGGAEIRFPMHAASPDAGYAPRGDRGVYTGYFPDGRPVLFTLARVPGTDWVVVSAIEQDEIYARAPALVRNTALVVLLALTAAALLILALFRQQRALNHAMLASVLREREALDQHFSYLTRFANDIVLLQDADGAIVNCNDRALSAYGYTRQELLGRNVLELRPEGLVAAGRRQLSAAKSEGGLLFETWNRRKDGGEFPVEISTRPFEVDGEIFLQSIIRDITERKRAEEELRRSELRFRNTFDHAALGMAHVASDGRILMVNTRFAELLGHDAAELELMTLGQLTVSEDLPRGLAQFDALLAGRQLEYKLEQRYRRSDGNVLWAQLTASAVRDEGGRIQYLVCAIEDIGARKQLAAQLQRRTLLYRTLSETNRAIARARCFDELLAEACSIAVAHGAFPLAAAARQAPVPDGPLVIAAAGEGALELTTELFEVGAQNGLLPGGAAARSEDGIIVVNDVERGAVSAGARLACLRRGVRAYASFLLGIPGSPAAWFTVYSPEPGFFEGDTLDLLTDMARDLATALERFAERAARERAEERLREARDQLEERVQERTAELAAARDRAEEADHIKTAFLARMSHELRTPLNSIIGFSSLLLSGAPGELNEEQGKQLMIVRSAGERLLALIEDVLDIARLQAAGARLPREPVELRDLVVRVVEAFRPQANMKPIGLHAEIGPCVVLAEPRRLEQVLTHLISNAVKFTTQGQVTVRCRQLGGVVEIAVADTGPGIGIDERPRLFTPFDQLGRGDSREEGIGLGLAISQRVVAAMGGSISVESEPGHGATFIIRLDAGPPRGKNNTDAGPDHTRA
jgi:PAS domain S-box-containing protein